jgi:hypothetical protein
MAASQARADAMPARAEVPWLPVAEADQVAVTTIAQHRRQAASHGDIPGK